MEPEVIKAGMKPKPRPVGIFSRPLSVALQEVRLDKPEFKEITFPKYPANSPSVKTCETNPYAIR